MDTGYLNKLYGLEGQVAVVTGGGGILCGTMARAFGRLGARVVVLDVNLEAAQAVAGQIRADGNEALAVQANVLEPESLEQALGQIMGRYGRVDILVNGAGGNKKEATTAPDLSFFDLPQDAFQWVFNLNLLGTLLCTQVFGRQMVAQDSGTILNIASLSGFRPLTNVGAYSAAKAAVISLTQWMAVHLSLHYSKRIRVNALAPGFFLTEQNRFLLTDGSSGTLTKRGQTVLAHTPQARFGEADDLIGAAVWLVSPSAAFVHGTVVTVDGGFMAYGGV
ncbi:MAG: putative oxidoreductase UxuB [Chloroflexi bacterium ADurb.Bin180]|nr:MAG: putative oxidoreductase UxuB [Chloroflexi bacterium ADurb.Bin180]